MSVISSSLLISTYNWPGALRLCLLSVAAQKVLPDEVLIADDGSGIETKQLIDSFKKEFPVPLIHVWHEDRGFRKTRILNTAVRQSAGKYIIQVDGDVILHPFFIKDHLDVSENGTFVRGTRARLTEEKTNEMLNEGKINVNAFSGGVYHRLNALHLPLLKALGIRKENSGRSVRGSNLAFWKDDFVAVNGYNTDLNGWGHEDEELATRFINNGIMKKIVKLCAIQFHLHHAETSKENEPFHSQIIQTTIKNKTKTCVNGYSYN